jgi:hypothetical protein
MRTVKFYIVKDSFRSETLCLKPWKATRIVSHNGRSRPVNIIARERSLTEIYYRFTPEGIESAGIALPADCDGATV